MNTYLICITIIGLASLGMAWMPSLTKVTKISYAIFYVILGIIAYSIIPALPKADPLLYQDVTLHLTELVVIVSIMGTGLKIDEKFSFKLWEVPFRLVTITMVLCIAAVAFIAWYFLNFSLASSLLLGAVLAPTDPVLAADVQVGPPQKNDKHNARFSLTAEAGMNDGMAFPFTWLAIAFASTTALKSPDLFHWLWMDVLYRIAAGVIVGFVMGKILSYLVITLPEKKNFVVIKDGFVGVAATLLVYGITEMIHGYGFITVFVTAITLRNSEMNHDYHKKLHGFTDQIEKILLAIVLILLGGALTAGILRPLTTNTVIFGLVFLFLIRPISGILSLIRFPMHIKEKLAISFFGIRGMGSIFYLAFAISKAEFNDTQELYAIVCFIILVSIFIHGITATTVMQKLTGKFEHIETTINKQK